MSSQVKFFELALYLTSTLMLEQLLRPIFFSSIPPFLHSFIRLLFYFLVKTSTSLTQDSGRITTPNYPQTYEANTEHTWRLEVNPNFRVALNLTDLRLQQPDFGGNCSFDRVAVYEGDGAVESQLKAR
jgi:hypothetical protein